MEPVEDVMAGDKLVAKSDGQVVTVMDVLDLRAKVLGKTGPAYWTTLRADWWSKLEV